MVQPGPTIKHFEHNHKATQNHCQNVTGEETAHDSTRTLIRRPCEDRASTLTTSTEE